MRVVLLGPASPWRGGIAHFNDLLARELRRRHELSVLTFTRQYPRLLFPGKHQTHPGESSLDVGAELLLDSISPSSWWRCARRIRQLNPDLFVLRYWMPFFAPCFGSVMRLSRRGGGPEIVVIADNVIPHERRPLDGALTRWALAPADRFVVMSNSVHDDLRRMRSRARIDVVPHPLYGQFGDPIPKPEARRRLGLEPDVPLLLFFGFIREYKGLDILLEALPRVRQRLPARLAVVGEFYAGEKETREQLSHLGLQEAVTLVDRYVGNDEVGPWFSAADVVVLPYRHATQSGIIPVAYHMGRPVISTRVGGLGEVVDEGRTGLLVPPEDPQALADAILRYFEEGLEASLSEGVRRERERYSWENFARAVEGTTARSPAPERDRS